MKEVRPGEEMGEAWKKMKWGLGRGKPCRGGSLGRGSHVGWRPGEEDIGSLSCLRSIWYFLPSKEYLKL